MTLPRTARLLACVAGAAALLAMSACSAPSSPEEETSSGSVKAPWGSASAAPRTSAAAKPKPSTAADPLAPKVGGTFTYPDGVVLSVVSISRTTFRPEADGYVAGNVAVLVTIKVTNRSHAPVDASVTTHMHTGKDGAEAGRVFDVRAGAGRGPHGTVPVGSSVSGTVGFSVAPANLGPAFVQVNLHGSDHLEEPVFAGTIS